MHSKLAQALAILDIGSTPLFNENREIVRKITPLEHASALFTYLDLAGYLSPELLKKAVIFMSAAKPFSVPNEVLIQHLQEVCQKARCDGEFNTDWFFDHFCNIPGFEVVDIIELIVFLQQTAFDRKFGEERDKLQAKPWLEEHQLRFQELVKNLGIVTPLPPAHDEYRGTGIMGAASVRVQTRIEYFNTLTVVCGKAWALSGDRELSYGLDKEDIMLAVAAAVGKPAVFIEKGEGAAKRNFLDGVTETMMVNYLLQKLCPGKKIALVNSAVEEGHWRATAAQGAKDIARNLIQEIQRGDLLPDDDGLFRFMIIAEQPYAGRMARQVQRAFNAEIQNRGLSSLKVLVEGVGPGIADSDLNQMATLTRLNSELGALMAERYNDARLQLQSNPEISLRDPKILLFSSRDTAFNELEASKEATSSSSMVASSYSY